MASGTSVSSGPTGRGRTTPRPVWEAWDQAFAGTMITPSEPRVKFSGQVIVSLDWHQVLDIKRHSRGTDRPSPPYTLLPEYEQLIRGLKDRGVAVLVCSYTCKCTEIKSRACRGSIQICLTTSLPPRIVVVKVGNCQHFRQSRISALATWCISTIQTRC